MPNLVAVYAVLTFVLASPAFAYTYTCQEGHFQIDVPEGWKTSIDNHSGGLSINFDFYNGLVIFWHLKTNPYSEQFPNCSYPADCTLQNAYRIFKNEILSWGDNITVKSEKFLTALETQQLGVDEGFIILINGDGMHNIDWFYAYFIKNKTIYNIRSYADLTEKNFELRNASIIKTFNSFRALD